MHKSSKVQSKLFLRFVKYILPYRKKWLAILVLSGLGMLLGLINPYLTKLVVDEAIGNKDLRIFIILVLIGGSVFVLAGLVDGVRQFLDRYIKSRVTFDLNKKVFKYMQNFPFSWFQDKSTGEHLYKISYDIERVTDFITTTPPQAISIFPRLLFTLGIVFYLNWRMAIFSLCLAPFLYLPPYYFSRRMRKVWKALIENYEDIFKNLEEAFSHIQLVKVFGKEITSIRNHLKRLITNVRIGIRNIRLEILSGFTAQIVSKVIVGLIAFYGGYQVIKGQMTLGSLTAVMVYLRQLMGLQGEFANFFQGTVLGLVSCQRVAEILDEKSQIVEVKDAKRAIFERGEVIFKDVSFGYSSQGHILRNISFRIEGGSHIALVGPSGCGKTTLLALILRLYDVKNGSISIDGLDIKDIKLKSLKEQIGIALQEPFLWNDTVACNILYGTEDASEEDMIKAARIAKAHDFIMNLPKQYHSIIGEMACKISEGQKQRIAIARAMIKRPKISILDESMSSVDSETEDKIVDNIRREFKDSTIIITSHRLSTVKKMDLVYFLENSSKIDIGTHDDLLARNQRYRDLFASQVEEEQLNTETRKKGRVHFLQPTNYKDKMRWQFALRHRWR